MYVCVCVRACVYVCACVRVRVYVYAIPQSESPTRILCIPNKHARPCACTYARHSVHTQATARACLREDLAAALEELVEEGQQRCLLVVSSCTQVSVRVQAILEREGEGGRGAETEGDREKGTNVCVCVCLRARACACMCVCVCALLGLSPTLTHDDGSG